MSEGKENALVAEVPRSNSWTMETGPTTTQCVGEAVCVVLG